MRMDYEKPLAEVIDLAPKEKVMDDNVEIGGSTPDIGDEGVDIW